MKATVSEIKVLLKEHGADAITIRLDRPADFRTNPRRPALVVPGIGPVAVRGGNHNHLVVELSSALLEKVDPNVVLESPDLDLAMIRTLRAQPSAVEEPNDA